MYDVTTALMKNESSAADNPRTPWKSGCDPAMQDEIRIARPVYDQRSFDAEFRQPESVPSAEDRRAESATSRVGQIVRRRLKAARDVRPVDVGRAVASYLPVLGHLKNYRWKAWILSDIVSGLSAGVVHVPQGMGFALLAGLPPVYGLYSSIFPGWLYYLLGTSRHLSVGTMALTALMVGAVVNRIVPPGTVSSTVSGSTLHGNASTSTSPGMWTVTTPFDDASVTSSSIMADMTPGVQQQQQQQDDNIIALKVGVAVSVSLIAGLFQLLMRVCRLGVVANYMSMPFVGGFMTGSALQIMISQIPFELGLAVKRPTGVFESPLLLVQVFRHIRETNISALVASIVSLTFLVSVKEGINEKFKSKLKLPVPAELILVISATIVSHFCRLHARYGLAVIGKIPTGLPTPRMPPLTGFSDYVVDGIVLGIVAFAIAVSMAKLMADRHRYEIDVSQELLACGVYNTVSSFFGCFASTQAPPRTLVHETTGCRTQLAGFISTILPLLVVLCLGPLFESLPTSVLGCIITCALLPLMKQFPQLKPLWIVNRFDCVVWVVTFVCTLVFSVTVGLGVGVGLSVLLVVVQAQRVTGRRLFQAANTEIYFVGPSTKKEDKSDDAGDDRPASPAAAIAVYRYGGAIFYANVDRFVDDLYRATFNPDRQPAVCVLTVDGSPSGQQCRGGGGATNFLAKLRRGKKKTTMTTNAQLDDGGGVGLNGHCSAVDLQKSEELAGGDAEEGEEQSEGNGTTPVDQEAHSWPGGVGEPTVVAESPLCRRAAEPSSSSSQIGTIVLDCSAVSFVDVMGVNAIKKVWTAFGLAGVNVVAVGCDAELVRKMTVVGLLKDRSRAGKEAEAAAAVENGKAGCYTVTDAASDEMEIYPTVCDAVVAAKLKHSY